MQDEGGGLSFVPYLDGYCKAKVRNNFGFHSRRFVEAHLGYRSLDRDSCDRDLRCVRWYNVMLGKISEIIYLGVVCACVHFATMVLD